MESIVITDKNLAKTIFGFYPQYVEFDFLLNEVNFYSDNYANIYLTPKNETKIIW